MVPIIGRSGIVIVGNWNYAIFSPEWIAKYLLPDEQLDVDFPVNRIGSLRTSNKELSIVVIENKFQILAKLESQEVYRRIISLALKISEYLPHTPVSAIGINYHFESAKVERLKQLFSFSDLQFWEKAGYLPNQCQIIRSFKFGDAKSEMFLTIVRDGEESYKLHFNNHFIIESLTKIKELLSDEEMVIFRKTCLEIAEYIYDIKLD